jgi:hypothetical protein
MQDLAELPGDGGGDAVPLADRRLVEEARPDAVQRRLLVLVVPAVDALELELVKVADQILGGQKDCGLDARDLDAGLEFAGGPLELVLEFLRLQVGEVQRVLDRPGPAAVSEQPGRVVVGGPRSSCFR